MSLVRCPAGKLRCLGRQWGARLDNARPLPRSLSGRLSKASTSTPLYRAVMLAFEDPGSRFGQSSAHLEIAAFESDR